MTSLFSPELRKAAAIFGWGTGVGFLLGVFLVTGVVWRFGNVTLSSDGGGRHARDAGRAVGTTGAGADVAIPAPAPGTVIAPVPTRELAARDLLIPVEGVGPERLIRSFADARGARRTHEAIDILAPRDTPVRAVEDGTIARLFVSKGGGITVYQFDPDRRYCYYYAHLERYATGLAEGQRVAKGQVIGYVGVSGNAPKDTPHLHFAIYKLTDGQRWWEGTPVDPYDVLQ